MASRPLARCRHEALRPRPRPSSQAGIWITDQILNEVLEEYNHGSRTQCRYLNSLPGPLENRRRIGRRNLTGYLPTSGPSSSLPQFELLHAPRTWHWEPPTTSALREEARRSGKTRPWNLSRLSNAFLDWLEDVEPPIPFLTPPAEVITPQEALPKTLRSDTTSPLVQLRAAICSYDEVSWPILDHLIAQYIWSLGRDIRIGSATTNTIISAMDPLDVKAKAHVTNPELEWTVISNVRQSVIAAIHDTYEDRPENISDETWIALAQTMSDLIVQREDPKGRLFRKILSIMPENLRTSIPIHSLLNAVESLVIGHANEDPHTTSSLAFAGKYCSTLKKFSSEQTKAIDSHVRCLLCQTHIDATQRLRLSHSWALIKSFHSGAWQHPSAGHATPYELGCDGISNWQLAIGRLVSTGDVEEVTRDMLFDTRGTSAERRWTHTVFTLLEQQPDLIAQLCNVLRETNQLSAFIRIITAPPLRQRQLMAAKLFAKECQDPILSLRINNAIDSEGFVDAKTWNWTAWVSHTEQLLQSPETEVDVLHLLRLTQSSVGHKQIWGKGADDAEAKARFLSQMSQWYMSAAHLNDRQLFRRVEMCLTLQQRLQGSPSLSTLTDLTNVVLRDMEAGRPGRNTRLAWLIGLVEKYQGQEAAEKAKQALNNWKWLNKQQGVGS